MTRVLVTGANGFIGREVVSALQRRGYTVHALTRQSRSTNSGTGVTWHCVDVFARDNTRALLETLRPEGLIHLAWESTHGQYWRAPSNLEWLASSLLLLNDFAQMGGQRAVIAGSSAEYQWGGLAALDEHSSPRLPDSLYGASQKALYEVIERWAPQAGLSWAWCRFFNVFGANEKPQRIVPKVIRSLLAGESLPLDSGSIARDFLHVADAGDAVAALFQSAVQGAVNIASGKAITLRELVSLVAAYLQADERVKFGVQPDPTDQPRFIVASVKRLHTEVGWQPHESFEKRIYQTCDGWRASHDSFARPHSGLNTP